jgi:hypothetical protein
MKLSGRRHPCFGGLRLTAVIILSAMPICCIVTMKDKPSGADNQFVGTWRYEECTIKNTSVQGTITFFVGGILRLDAYARDDCPVPKISGKYHYCIQGSTLETDYDKGYGLSPFFLVKGDHLYFSTVEIQEPVEEWVSGRQFANWTFKLVRER